MLKPVLKHWQLDEEEFGRVLRINDIGEKLAGKSYLEAFQYRRITNVVSHAERLEKQGTAFKLLEIIDEGYATRTGISEFTGISRETIRHWLNGDSKPSRSSTFKLAAFIEALESDGADEFKYELNRFVRSNDNTGISFTHTCTVLGITKMTLMRWVSDPTYVPTEGNVKDFLPWLKKFNKARADLSKIMDTPPASLGKSKVGRRARIKKADK